MRFFIAAVATFAAVPASAATVYTVTAGYTAIQPPRTSADQQLAALYGLNNPGSVTLNVTFEDNRVTGPLFTLNPSSVAVSFNGREPIGLTPASSGSSIEYNAFTRQFSFSILARTFLPETTGLAFRDAFFQFSEEIDLADAGPLTISKEYLLGRTVGFGLSDFKSGMSSSSAFVFGRGTITAVSISGPEVVAYVPEPATWAMMIFGFGMVGATVRRTTRKVTFA